MTQDVAGIPPPTINAISVGEIEQAINAMGDNNVPEAVVAPVQRVVSNPLKEFIDVEQLKKDVEFNPNDLDNAVSSHASMYLHYANLARQARAQYMKMKNAFAILESRLEQHHRQLMTGVAVETKVKPTEPQIKAAVMTDPRWWSASNRLIDAQEIHNLAQDAKTAFEQRKDMIVQMSVDRREERKGQLRIMEGKEAEKAVQDARVRAMAIAGGASKVP